MKLAIASSSSWADESAHAGAPRGGALHAHRCTSRHVGSFVPASSAVDPTLTIIVNALRVGDVIRQGLV